MNRMDEYSALLAELEKTPAALEYSVSRARSRCRRRRWLWRPATTLAGLFAAFVLLVNMSPTAAYAMSRVPGLEALAQAVTFSRSLTTAVEHDYVQPIDQEKTENGITVRLEYLIVDQKQLNIFYTVAGEGYDYLDATPWLREADGGEELYGFTLSTNGNTDGLRHIAADFLETEMPSRLRLSMDITGRRSTTEAPTASVEEDMFKSPAEWEAELEEDILARMDFYLEFDPAFTQQGRTVAVNQSVELDGQTLTVTELEIFPTHMRLNVEPAGDNTAWLKGLSFYVENRWGRRYDPAASGITATGDGNGQMVSYRMDSTWFYEETELTLVVTAAEWLDKDRELVRLDLTTGTADWMPQGTELKSVEKTGKGYIVTVLAEEKRPGGPMYSVFSGPWLDSEGNEHEIRSWSAGYVFDENFDQIEGCFEESFPLVGCKENVVWLRPTFSRLWTAPEEIRLLLTP